MTVLFAASDRSRHHHAPSLELVATATPSEAFVAAHSMAELYATLSATRAPKMRRRDHVLEAVEQVAKVFTPVDFTSDDYLRVIRRVASAGGRSGLVYDALILRAAEKSGADAVYTWNQSHFKRIAWPEVAGRIRTP